MGGIRETQSLHTGQQKLPACVASFPNQTTALTKQNTSYRDLTRCPTIYSISNRHQYQQFADLADQNSADRQRTPEQLNRSGREVTDTPEQSTSASVLQSARGQQTSLAQILDLALHSPPRPVTAGPSSSSSLVALGEGLPLIPKKDSRKDSGGWLYRLFRPTPGQRKGESSAPTMGGPHPGSPIRRSGRKQETYSRFSNVDPMFRNICSSITETLSRDGVCVRNGQEREEV